MSKMNDISGLPMTDRYWLSYIASYLSDFGVLKANLDNGGDVDLSESRWLKIMGHPFSRMICKVLLGKKVTDKAAIACAADVLMRQKLLDMRSSYNDLYKYEQDEPDELKKLAINELLDVMRKKRKPKKRKPKKPIKLGPKPEVGQDDGIFKIRRPPTED